MSKSNMILRYEHQTESVLSTTYAQLLLQQIRDNGKWPSYIAKSRQQWCTNSQ